MPAFPGPLSAQELALDSWGQPDQAPAVAPLSSCNLSLTIPCSDMRQAVTTPQRPEQD